LDTPSYTDGHMFFVETEDDLGRNFYMKSRRGHF